MSCCDQPDPRPNLYSKSGMGLFGGKLTGCCCSPRVHAWGGVILSRETGAATGPFAIPWPGDSNFDGFQRAADSSTAPNAWSSKRWFPQFPGAITHGACYQGRLKKEDIDSRGKFAGQLRGDDIDPENPEPSDKLIGDLPFSVEPPTQPATFDVRPKTAVLCQLPWVRFSQKGFGGGISVGGSTSIALGVTEGGTVYGWGNMWPLPKYNARWASEYIDGRSFRASSLATDFDNKESAQRTWMTPVPLDFGVGTGIYIDASVGFPTFPATPELTVIALIDSAGDVHVGTYAAGQGEYEIRWDSYPLDAKEVMVLGPSTAWLQYRVVAVRNDGSIAELRFNSQTQSLIETVTHQQATFASLFPSNLHYPTTFLPFGALTTDGKIYIFFGQNIASSGGQANTARAYDTDHSYVSAGFDEPFTQTGNLLNQYIYGLRTDGDITQISMYFDEVRWRGRFGTLPGPQRRKKFVQATFTGLDKDPNIPFVDLNLLEYPNRRLSILAIAEDGRLWGFGENRSYQLGDGTRDNRDFFVQIGRHRWKHVMFGRGYSWNEPAPNFSSVLRNASVALAIFDSYADEEPLYFTGDAKDGDWSNPKNWRFGEMPTAESIVIAESLINKNTLNRPTTVANFTQELGGLGIGITVSGTAVFPSGSSLTNAGSVTGNAVFNGTSSCGGLVSGTATFNDGAVLAGNFARVNGIAVFNDNSRNGANAIVTGSATFSGSSENGGVVNGDSLFNANSRLVSGGRVNGNAVFNGTSRNNIGGTVTGNAAFNENSRNSGAIGTDQSNAHQFNGSACNTGTVNGSVTVDGQSVPSAPPC